MKLRNPRLIRWLAWLAARVVRVWMSTIRYTIHFPEERHPPDPRRSRFIYMFWHESLLFPTRFPTSVRMLISQHADGEFVAQMCGHMGFGVVRGSKTRGGQAAMLDMVRASRRNHLAVTPDGPRGPRRQVHAGVVSLASLTGLPIVSLGIAWTKASRARSWDRFAVPWPFSGARCVVVPAVRVPPRLDRNQLEHYRQLVEEQLNEATTAAERWAEAGVRPARLAPDRAAFARAGA